MKCHDSNISNTFLWILHSLNGDTRHNVLFCVHVWMTMYRKFYFLKMIFFFSWRICYNGQRVVDNLNVLNHRSLKLQIIVKLPKYIEITTNIPYFIFNVLFLTNVRKLSWYGITFHRKQIRVSGGLCIGWWKLDR